jgi:hypothetical protein
MQIDLDRDVEKFVNDVPPSPLEIDLMNEMVACRWRMQRPDNRKRAPR